MASTQFENGIKDGIAIDQAWMTQYVTKIAEGVERIDGIKQDRFSDIDTKSITATLEELNEINEKVDKTNYLYVKYPEKKELMEKIIEEMTTYKDSLAKIDSSEYQTSCKTYNDNLEAARLAVITNDEIKDLEKYKKDPEPLTLSVSGNDSYNNNKKVSFTCQVAKLNGNKLTVLTRTLQSWYPELKNMSWKVKTKDDGFSVPEKFKGKIKAASIPTAHEKFNKAKSILDGRNRSTGRTLDAKRED